MGIRLFRIVEAVAGAQTQLRLLVFVLIASALASFAVFAETNKPKIPESWRESPLIAVLNFAQLDLRSNHCEKGKIPACDAVINELDQFEQHLSVQEHELYMSSLSREQAAGYLNLQIKVARDTIAYLELQRKGERFPERPVIRRLLARIQQKVEIVKEHIFESKMSRTLASDTKVEHYPVIFGAPGKNEIVAAQNLKRATAAVIEDPSLFTVRGIMRAGNEMYEQYQASGKKDPYYSKEMHQKIEEYYRASLASWDKACWICDREHYVNAVHNMMNFGLLIGGGNSERFLAGAKERKLKLRRRSSSGKHRMQR